jgi:hypothetical protein
MNIHSEQSFIVIPKVETQYPQEQQDRNNNTGE